MNKKQVIRLTESDLHRIVKESVKIVLCENSGLNQFEESPLWGNGYGDYEKDIAHIQEINEQPITVAHFISLA